MNSASSLQQAVSELVRASMGSSVSETISNEELDRHVAELILQEAKQKEDQYEELGLRAYLPAKFPESTAPKTNKRFLSSVIRSTDDHNRSLLKAQALAAAEAKARKEDEERHQRLLRAQEASESRRIRHRRERRNGESSNHRHHRHKRKERSWDEELQSVSNTSRSRKSRSKARKESPSNDKDRSGGRNRSASPHQRTRDDSSEGRGGFRKSSLRSPSNHPHEPSESLRRVSQDEAIDDSGGTSWQHTRRAEKSRLLLRGSLSPERSSAISGSSSGAITTELFTQTVNDQPILSVGRPGSTSVLPSSKFKRIGRPPSPSPATNPDTEAPPRNHSRTRSSSPTLEYSSRMDRYFSETYDPRLDMKPLSKRPDVPKDGLVPADDFEGWDAMLEAIQLRRQDKMTKKRLGMVNGREETSKKKKRKKGEKTLELAWETVAKKRQALDDREPAILDIRYQKQGSVREWDMGKVDIDLLL